METGKELIVFWILLLLCFMGLFSSFINAIESKSISTKLLHIFLASVIATGLYIIMTMFIARCCERCNYDLS